MADNVKIDRIVDDNGRRVETRVYETVVDGQKQRIVETHVEEIPMALHERVVESIAPVVTTRKKETYKDGQVVDSVVEELDHGTMKMTVAQPQPSNTLTKEDLKEVLHELLNARDNVREVRAVKKKVVVPPAPPKPPKEVEVEEEEDEPTPVTPVKVESNKMWDWLEIGAYVILSGELAFCLYHLVLKNWL